MHISRAMLTRAEQYASFLYTTELGKKYYPRIEYVQAALEQGLAEDELYEAREEPDGELIGVLWFQKQGVFHQYPYLHIVAVDERYRGRGLGSALLDFFEKESLVGREGKKLLRTKVFLVVDAANDGARRLYEKRGYVQVGEIDGLYRRNVTELLLMNTVSVS